MHDIRADTITVLTALQGYKTLNFEVGNSILAELEPKYSSSSSRFLVLLDPVLTNNIAV